MYEAFSLFLITFFCCVLYRIYINRHSRKLKIYNKIRNQMFVIQISDDFNVYDSVDEIEKIEKKIRRRGWILDDCDIFEIKRTVK